MLKFLNASRITEGGRVFAKNVSQMVTKRFNVFADFLEVGFNFLIRHYFQFTISPSPMVLILFRIDSFRFYKFCAIFFKVVITIDQDGSTVTPDVTFN